MPRTTRKYPSLEKTTTPEGRREYIMYQMRDLRQRRKEQMDMLKQLHPDVYREVFGQPKRMPKTKQPEET